MTQQVSGRMRALWRVLWRSRQLETDMRDEMRFHVEMEADRLRREQGLDPQEARRQAYVRFGGVEKYKEAGRDARGWQWLDAIALDTRLGVRMLAKYPGLTLIGGFAMTVAIAIGAMAFEALGEMLDPALPLPDGDRIVSVQYASANPATRERAVLTEFVAWRDELKSIEHLGAFRTVQHNLVTGHTPPEPVKVAEISAAGFDVARTPPLAGRYLLPGDERDSAPAVLVVGYQVWQSRFGGDPGIAGRVVHLGGVARTVVGVMPDSFRFPYEHQYWIPLQANPLAFKPLDGPSVYIFGRLAPGFSMEQAQAELTAISQRQAATDADTGEPLRARVNLYTRDHVDLTQPKIIWLVRLGQLLTGALAFVVAVNLAILLYARTVTRLGEIAVRTALGASRRRILAQLFIEAFALSLLGAVSGLALADVALGYVQYFAKANGGVPFWIRFELSPTTAAFALGLATFAAVIMGVLPGLKATGSNLNRNLHELNNGTATRLGAVWTTLVVAQVAVAVAVLPVAVYMTWQVVQMEITGPGFAAERFVVGTVYAADHVARDFSPATARDTNRLRTLQLDLMARLRSEPGVADVTFSAGVPGFSGGRRLRFQEGVAVKESASPDVSILDVAPEMFGVYGAGLLAGRPFSAGDTVAANAVIVNESFAQRFAPSGNPLGMRFRYQQMVMTAAGRVLHPEPWYEVVGVVRDVPSFPPGLQVEREPVVYHAAAAGALHPVTLSVGFNGPIPTGFIDRFREIGGEVDATLQLRRVLPLMQFYDEVRGLYRYIAWGIGLLTLSVLLLSAAGIYALTSFTVAQRTREIGIRMALGAHPRRLLFGVFARVLRQLAIGGVVGSLAAATVVYAAGLAFDLAIGLLLVVVAIIVTVGAMAAAGPARRSLHLPASEALRADA